MEYYGKICFGVCRFLKTIVRREEKMKKIFKRLLSITLAFMLMICGLCQQKIELKAELANENPNLKIGESDNQGMVGEENDDKENDDEENDDEENFDDCITDDLSNDEMLEVSYEITSKWNNHYNVNVTLKNVSGELIDDWEIYFDFKDKIENIWNAKIVEIEDGESVVIHNAGWNQDIPIEESVTFGMTVNYEGNIEFPQVYYLTRESVEVNEEDYVVEYIQNSKWENHVNGQIKITNIGTKPIEDWKLGFETSNVVNEIENIWNAKLIEIYEGVYCQVNNAEYNQNIEPGQSVEFGFIARCTGDIEIEETVLYSMQRAECEYEEEEDEIVDLNDPDWEPRYDLDDFDTIEEYQEYCNKIGYHPISTVDITSSKSIEPFVKTEIVCKVKKGDKGKAIQSYLWDTIKKENGEKKDVLLTLFRLPKKVKKGGEPKNANNFAHFNKATKNDAGYYFSDQTESVSMEKFSHGQSFERCKVDGKKKYILASGADDGIDGWSKNIAFINDSLLLGAKAKIKYDNNKIKKITGFKYLIDKEIKKNSKIVRLDTALSADGKVLAVWIKVAHFKKRVILLFDMKKIKKRFYGKKSYSTYPLKINKLREDVLIAKATAPSGKLQPNKSFQSIEVSNKYAKSNKYKIYITSGNTGKGQPLKVTRAVLGNIQDNKFAELTDFKAVQIDVPHNKQGAEILSGECELEGCHIKGDELQFIMTKSNNELDSTKALKVVQYIVGIDKKFK